MRRMVLGAAEVVLLAGSGLMGAQAPIIRNIGGSDYSVIDYTYYDARSNASGNWDMRGRLYVPDNLNPNVTHPLVMFLHGDGEAGTNNTGPVNDNINNLIRNARVKGFLVYVPQAPYTYWDENQLFLAQTMIGKTVKEYNVDPNRISVTGLSKGGSGVAQVARGYTNQYASFIPLSMASSMSAAEADAANGRPLWAFHGRPDAKIGVGTTRGTITALAQRAGGPAPVYLASNNPSNYQYDYGNLHYTEYAVGGHDNVVWSNGAYNTDALYTWMLQQQTQLKTLQTSKKIAINFNRVSSGTESGLTVDSAGRTWNNVSRYGAELTQEFAVGFARDTDGLTTLVHVETTNAFLDQNTSNIPSGITAFEDPTVAGRYWRTESKGLGQFTIRGLIPGGKYDLSVFASTTQSNYVGIYSVDDQSATLNATNNLSTFANLPNLAAGADGTLVLNVAPSGSANYAVINGFTLTAVPEPASAAMWMMMGQFLRRRPRR